jgi:hypothetical protein
VHLENGSALSRRGLLALAAVATLAAACGTPVVQVGDVPNPEAQDVSDCTALTAALPKKIGDKLEKRTVEPKSPLLAAWGKPAVVLRCGVGIPSTYRPATDLTIVNNIGWFGDDRPDDVVYTTITREPRVALAVPKVHRSSFEILVDLSTAIGKNTQGPDLTPQ